MIKTKEIVIKINIIKSLLLVLMYGLGFQSSAMYAQSSLSNPQGYISAIEKLKNDLSNNQQEITKSVMDIDEYRKIIKTPLMMKV
jgi:hypothetical protein